MEEENAQDRKRMFSWMNPKLEVRDTGKYGKGVFAKENLKKDEVLAIFGGGISLEKEWSGRMKKYCPRVS